MLIEAKIGSIAKEASELAVVGLFEEEKELTGAAAALDSALGGRITDLLSWGDFRGTKGETSVVYPGANKVKRVLLVGLGKRAELDTERVRLASAAAARKAVSIGVTSYTTAVPEDGNRLKVEAAAQALAEGAILAGYRTDLHRTEKEPHETKPLEKVLVLLDGSKARAAAEAGIRAGQAVASAVNWARDLANEPANYITPSALAEQARQMARESGLRCQVLGPEEMRRLGMGALLGVAQGSAQEARFIVVEYKPKGKAGAPLVLVGKGITFDSGGISLKPDQGMEMMKGDMAGAAAVLAAVKAIAALGLPRRVIGLLPATENLPIGTAYKPGDVLTSITGKTIEVISTDAEGRLILADALGYGQRFKPAAMIDLATLTGACVVALGNVGAGLFANNDDLASRVESASRESGEKVWRMPLWPEYAEQIKSDVADMKNTGGRPAGAITAALLLSKFAGDTPWVHLDIAGVSGAEKETALQPRGATGFGVRLLVQLVRDWR